MSLPYLEIGIVIMIKARIAESILPKSASIVVNLLLNIMMPSVFVTDIQNELCYSN